MRRLALAAALLTAASAAAQPPPGWGYPDVSVAPAPAVSPLPALPPAPLPTGLPERPPETPCPPPLPDRAAGQQHRVQVGYTVFQPFTARVGVKVWDRPNDSLWVDLYAGSVLFDLAFAGGLRVQHTARSNGRGDALMVSPGAGVYVLPWRQADVDRWVTQPDGMTYRYRDRVRHTAAFVYADVDIGWLHDFGDHCGFELGVKVGLAGRVSGRDGGEYPRAVMFGRDLFPVLAVYSGLRF